MSHFSVTVLIPGDTPLNEIEDAVTRLLAPYDEDIETEPYEEKCRCVGCDAGTDARQRAEAETDFHGRRAAMLMDRPDERGDEWDAKWARMCDECDASRDRILAADHRKDDADLECDECHGTGTRMSTYNPESKWDWYVIGGRWDGYITDETVPTAADCPAGAAREHFGPHIAHGQNVRLANALRDDYSTYAIVTPDGEWCEKGKMGWWAVSTNEDPDWPENIKSIFAKHDDCLAVMVDCHI